MIITSIFSFNPNPKGQTMKRAMLVVAVLALGLAGCNKEQPKPATPAAPITSAPTPAPAAAPAAADAAKAPAEAPKAEAGKAEASKDAKK